MQSKRMGLFTFGVGCLLAASALVFAAGLPERSAFTGRIDADGTRFAPEMGAQAPLFVTTQDDGAHFDLSAYAGQAVVLNFWATWCGPCQDEMPELQALYQRYGERGLVIVGVNTGETLEEVQRWRDRFALRFPLVMDPTGEISALYAIRGQPQTFVIAPDGAIVQIYFGPATRTMLEDVLRPYLETAFVPRTQESLS